MKIYTLYSESHRPLFDNWFYKSLKLTNPDCELIKLETPQVCKTGNFMEDGWLETMVHKNEFIINSLNETKENEIILHCDADVQFFKNIETSLDKSIFNTYDVLCQADGPYAACYGVLFIKNTQKAKNLFLNILNLLKTFNNIQIYNDQNIFNHTYKQFGLNVGLLDYKYYSIWRATNSVVWEPGMVLQNPIPNDLILHHANFTVSVDNKIKLMEIVKNNQLL